MPPFGGGAASIGAAGVAVAGEGPDPQPSGMPKADTIKEARNRVMVLFIIILSFP
jgi:hypothetical protein